MERPDRFLSLRVRQWSVRLDRYQQRSGLELDGAGLRPRRRRRQHQRHPGEWREEGDRLRTPVSDIRIGHLARGPVLGHLDRVADLIGWRSGLDVRSLPTLIRWRQPTAALYSTSVTCSIQVTWLPS